MCWQNTNFCPPNLNLCPQNSVWSAANTSLCSQNIHLCGSKVLFVYTKCSFVAKNIKFCGSNTKLCLRKTNLCTLNGNLCPQNTNWCALNTTLCTKKYANLLLQNTNLWPHTSNLRKLFLFWGSAVLFFSSSSQILTSWSPIHAHAISHGSQISWFKSPNLYTIIKCGWDHFYISSFCCSFPAVTASICAWNRRLQPVSWSSGALSWWEKGGSAPSVRVMPCPSLTAVKVTACKTLGERLKHMNTRTIFFKLSEKKNFKWNFYASFSEI